MPNQFLTEIHAYITEALTDAKSRQRSADVCNDQAGKHFYAGRIEELQALRRYLADHFDLSTQRYY
ncbi:MAG: hypothetical protein P1P89_20990 [Desulfobacterales bacterium]|nr:hypothetical protein [Desulfobacterales bacterium]